MLYVIGSVNYQENIEKVAKYFREEEGFVVEHVKPEPDRSLSSLITECFHKIMQADMVIAVKKPDGSYGTGTLYEVCFSKFIGKAIIEISPGDITDPNWLKSRKKY